jgi:large conductance mechanosensitive channel
MSFLKEFREFAIKGNVVDMAVGIIIGGAFGKIVTSLVGDVVMPPIGFLLEKLKIADVATLSYVLKEKTDKAEAVAIKYGAFINNALDFVIMAFVIFLVIQQMNRVRRMMEKPPEAKTKECPKCRMMIPVKATRCGHCTSELG